VSGLMALVVLAALTIAAESVLRLHRFRLAPFRLRALYASYLLSRGAVQALQELHQRAVRAGVRTFDGVYEVYARTSGRSRADMEHLFGLSLPLRALNRAELILRNRLQWHVGLVPLPGQRLRTVSTDELGRRRVPPGASKTGGKPVRTVYVTGGSVTFGFGATSDEATIAGRLEHYLNELDRSGRRRWRVINLGIPGGTSFQELIALLQSADIADPPSHVVSVSGWNDVDHQFHGGQANLSVLAQNTTEELERTGLAAQTARRLARRSVLLTVLKRFVDAYECWPGLDGGRRAAGHATDRQRALQGTSDIYPLW